MFDPEHPTLKSRMAAGECLALAWLTLGSVAMAEAVARARPDAIVIDMQHGLWERRDLESAIGLIPRDLPVIVRVAENSPLAIGTALDAGAEGVMVPLVETLADAKRALQSSRYPPRGKRSGAAIGISTKKLSKLGKTPSLVLRHHARKALAFRPENVHQQVRPVSASVSTA